MHAYLTLCLSLMMDKMAKIKQERAHSQQYLLQYTCITVKKVNRFLPFILMAFSILIWVKRRKGCIKVDWLSFLSSCISLCTNMSYQQPGLTLYIQISWDRNRKLCNLVQFWLIFHYVFICTMHFFIMYTSFNSRQHKLPFRPVVGAWRTKTQV